MSWGIEELFYDPAGLGQKKETGLGRGFPALQMKKLGGMGPPGQMKKFSY
jgi:hypothetical protein